MNAAKKSSTGLSYILSTTALAKGKQSPITKCFQIVGVQPLWGWGSFDSTSDYGLPKFKDTWPNIYSKLDEEMFYTDTGELIASKVQVWSKYYDQGLQTISSSGSFPGWGPSSTTVTDSLVTCTGTYSSRPVQYTLALSGTILDSSATGPFDPTDTTVGWSALEAIATSLLADISYPSTVSNTEGMNANIVFPFSGVGGWTSIQASFEYPFCAAIKGAPIRMYSSAGYTGESPGSNSLYHESIIDWPYPYTETFGVSWPSNNPVYGACISAKSIWVLNNKGVPLLPYGTTAYSDHKNLYYQQISAGSSDFTFGTVSSSIDTFTGRQSKEFTPASILSSYGISDAFGILGFRDTAG